MDYRHEWKIALAPPDLLVLRQRLRAVMQPDSHARDGRYRIRSLYFDTPDDRALREKLDGVSRREKYRIRCYNGDYGFIQLEKKCKLAGLGWKEQAPLSAEQVQAILDGQYGWLAKAGQPLLTAFYSRLQGQLLRPKTLVDYTREPFVYAPGNVRVTLDCNIRTGLHGTDFLDPACPTVPAPDASALMEVKWDTFLPDLIRDAVQLPGRQVGAFSKYAACRMYD